MCLIVSKLWENWLCVVWSGCYNVLWGFLGLEKFNFLLEFLIKERIFVCFKIEVVVDWEIWVMWIKVIGILEG